MRDFSTKVKLAYNRYLKAERSYPLDYLMKFPNKGTYEEEDIDRIQRKNLLKNVTLRIINDIRERKKRPSLKDLVYQYELRKDQPNAKEMFQNWLMKLYGEQNEDEDNDKDEKYKLLIETLTRVKQ